MTINKVGGIAPISSVQDTHRTDSASTYDGGQDTISISAEASQRAFLASVAEATPDIRSDRVAEVKELLKDPAYINKALLLDTADKILAQWGI